MSNKDNIIEQLRKEINILDGIKYSEVIQNALLHGKTEQDAEKKWTVIVERGEKLKKELTALLNGDFNAENSERSYKYYCSVCLIIRDENEYLEEWLNWHIKQGVQHFYIYDHGSKYPVKEFLKGLSTAIYEKVTVIDFGGKHDFAQHEAYNNCIEMYENESRWIGFIDSDEFVRIKNGKTIPEFLKDYEEYAGVFMAWVIYGANGHKEMQNLPCRRRFLNVTHSRSSEDMGKVFIQPELFSYMMIHNGYPKAGYLVVDEHKEPLQEAAIFKHNSTTDYVCVDHYYTKSYEEWLNKIKRGACDPYYSRKYDEFFDYNPDMEYCKEDVFPIQEYEISKK